MQQKGSSEENATTQRSKATTEQLNRGFGFRPAVFLRAHALVAFRNEAYVQSQIIVFDLVKYA